MSHGPGLTHPPYPSGLLLAGRRVVVVGAGRVAARRLPALLEAGAALTMVSPQVHPDVAAAAQRGEVTLVEREYEHGDLAGAWYAMASTDRPAVNAAVLEEADAARVFCVRADDAPLGSAWTPAVGHHAQTTVAVLSNRDPALSARTRDRLLAVLDGEPADRPGADG